MERPLPIPCAHDKEFWQAAAEDRLVVQKTAGGRWQAYPRAHALDDPMTRDAAPAFRQVSGRGRIESISVVHRSFYKDIPAPYGFAIVRLEEGVLMTGQITGADPASAAIGDPVTVTFLEVAPGKKLPCFTPAPKDA